MRIVSVVCPIVVLLLAGCGGSTLPPPVPASGKVTMNEQPVEGAVVTFLSTEGGSSASGRTESDGSFQLSTINTNDGARPGEYAITISKTDTSNQGTMMEIGPDGEPEFGEMYGAAMEASARGNMDQIFKNTLPEKYADAGTSGLKRTVVKGEPNEFNIEL